MGVMAAHLLLTLLLAGPAHLTPETPQGLEVRGHTSLRETPEPFKVVVSEGCVTSGSQQEGKELELQPGGSLVLTHRISLRTPSGPGACGCQEELGRVLGRLEGLEREVSALRASCSAGGGCCSSSTESKGAGCLVQPDPGAPRLCPGGCSDQGRCVGGACECFHGYSGPDCSRTPCPADCSDRGRCVDGGCECDPGYTGPDCSLGGCPGNCNGRERCVNGACACSTGFTGLDCSEESCPSNCNERGQCLNGECVCGPEFKGPDCSERSCPDNCRGHGQCVEGQCVCDPGFKGPDCSEKSCPSNCNARGSCLNGKCVCDPEFTGPDCSKKSCPSNCNKRGRCLNGKCACNPEFTGPDCSERSCPDNCNDRGRCVKGECVCDPGFTGPDCSEKSCPSNCHARGRCIDGQCSCDPEFTGPDCSEESCPSNCNKRGRCLNGKCICDPEFTGPDCSEKSCPSNCHARGRCIDGQCSCDPEFMGTDCSEKSCPDNCNDRGRCVKGQCVCDPEFRGPDCSEKSCPDNCNKRGQCVNGKCACNPKFTGSDCSERSCPGNCSGRGRCEAGRCVCDAGSSGAACAYRSCPAGCSGRGRCVEGRCVCRRAFSGADCGRCADGVTGPRCDQALSAVTGVMVDDITETSVILLWTPPPVEYQTYHITFTSEKDGEQQIRAQVPGGAVRYSQTGLAAGQAYTATIAGEMDGRAGAAHSVTFSTPPSGPTDLRVVKTSTSSAVVQWEPAQGPIDRYHLTVSPNDGAGKAQEMALPPGRDSAHIQHLEAGRLYDITLRAESGAGQSATAAAQVTPGPSPPTALAFSQVSEDSLRLTWTGPPAPVSGFKVTYTHTGEGEPISVVVGSQDSSLSLSQLTPGSSYEVSVISVLGLDESDPIKETVTTLPDPPSGLQVLNVTDSKALLLWRPATAAVDEYSIVYGTGERSDLRVTVSGNVVEKHLTGLEESTTYSVTITSLLGDTHSSPSTASFTTTQGEEEEEEEEGGAQHFQARQVTPRTALLSWEPPAATAVDRYRLTYQTEGEEPKEVTLNATTTNHKLRRLRPGSSYTATLRGERDGRPGPPVPAHFNTGPLRFPHPADCSEELLNGEGESGEVEVFLGGAPGVPLPVYCDMETDGGGWTVFQRRSDGAVDFFRGWKDYVKGFGELGGEFWMGLDNLHLLTSGADMSLRVDLRDGEEAAYARYSTFRVAKRNYRLSVAGYSGTAGDSMSYHSGRPFSTRDRDPDRSITRCAVSYRGGWWYWNCHKANLNGLYGSGERHQGVIWTTWKGKDFSVPFTEMKMRPSAFIPPAR